MTILSEAISDIRAYCPQAKFAAGGTNQEVLDFNIADGKCPAGYDMEDWYTDIMAADMADGVQDVRNLRFNATSWEVMDDLVDILGDYYGYDGDGGYIENYNLLHDASYQYGAVLTNQTWSTGPDVVETTQSWFLDDPGGLFGIIEDGEIPTTGSFCKYVLNDYSGTNAFGLYGPDLDSDGLPDDNERISTALFTKLQDVIDTGADYLPDVDLVLTDMDIDFTDANDVLMELDISNTGSEASGAFGCQVLVGTDSIGTFWTAEGLAASGSDTFTISIGPWTYGTVDVTGDVDYACSITETSELNNTITQADQP